MTHPKHTVCVAVLMCDGACLVPVMPGLIESVGMIQLAVCSCFLPHATSPGIQRGVLLHACRWDEAATDYQAVLAVAPDDPVPWNNLGNTYMGACYGCDYDTLDMLGSGGGVNNNLCVCGWGGGCDAVVATRVSRGTRSKQGQQVCVVCVFSQGVAFSWTTWGYRECCVCETNTAGCWVMAHPGGCVSNVLLHVPVTHCNPSNAAGDLQALRQCCTCVPSLCSSASSPPQLTHSLLSLTAFLHRPAALVRCCRLLQQGCCSVAHLQLCSSQQGTCNIPGRQQGGRNTVRGRHLLMSGAQLRDCLAWHVRENEC